jgi:TRAP-type mannitol/chloroaromatic compound transport system permease large subunit
MKTDNSRVVKFVILTIGIFLIGASAFSPILSRKNYLEFKLKEYIIGTDSMLWHFLVIPTIALFLIGFFSNHLAVKILFYVFLVPIAFFTFSVTAIANMGSFWGSPLIERLERGYFMALIGQALVVTATIISLHQPKKIKTKEIENGKSVV